MRHELPDQSSLYPNLCVSCVFHPHSTSEQDKAARASARLSTVKDDEDYDPRTNPSLTPLFPSSAPAHMHFPLLLVYRVERRRGA